MNNTVFVGYDPRETLASIACKYSINKHSTADVQFLHKKKLQHENLFYRKAFVSEKGQYFDAIDSKPFSTEFAFTRFLVPVYANQQQIKSDWVMFVDCDFLFLEDVNELFKQVDDKYSVMCVKFNWIPPEEDKLKMDNVIQTRYTKKLWSSLMLFNMNHPDIKNLSSLNINNATGSYLHKFQWTTNEAIGSLPVEWNYVPGVTYTQNKPKAIHYTKGGPWFEDYRDCPYGKEWLDSLDDIPKSYILNEMMSL